MHFRDCTWTPRRGIRGRAMFVSTEGRTHHARPALPSFMLRTVSPLEKKLDDATVAAVVLRRARLLPPAPVTSFTTRLDPTFCNPNHGATQRVAYAQRAFASEGPHAADPRTASTALFTTPPSLPQKSQWSRQRRPHTTKVLLAFHFGKILNIKRRNGRPRASALLRAKVMSWIVTEPVVFT